MDVVASVEDLAASVVDLVAFVDTANSGCKKSAL